MDISGDECVTVKPDSSFKLSTDGKSDIDATVVQDKIVWRFNETDKAKGVVTATDLSAGNWSGNFKFTISCEEVQPVTLAADLYDENDNMVVSWEDSGIDGVCANADTVIDTKEDIKKVIIPDSVTFLAANAFKNCTGLISIVIPDSVTKIDTGAFWNCTGLTDVYYTGTEAQWNTITNEGSNNCLTDATIHYNYDLSELKF